jgi:hypothetical protein
MLGERKLLCIVNLHEIGTRSHGKIFLLGKHNLTRTDKVA